MNDRVSGYLSEENSISKEVASSNEITTSLIAIIESESAFIRVILKNTFEVRKTMVSGKRRIPKKNTSPVTIPPLRKPKKYIEIMMGPGVTCAKAKPS